MSALPTSSTSTNPLLEQVVATIFDKMLLDYGKRFTDQWGAADPDMLRAHWAQELTGYTPREIKRGLAAMDGMDWPPTLPQFKKSCRPPVDALVAYYEAVEGVRARQNGEDGIWSHPAIYWAATPLSFDLQNQTYSQIKARWEVALEAQMARGDWEPIPAPALALPAPDKSHHSRENAAKMLQELGAAGVINDGGTRSDPLAWAKKILKREENGDKTLSAYCLREAKIAMGIIPMPGGGK